MIPAGWTLARQDKAPFKFITIRAPNGYAARVASHDRNPENVLYMLADALLKSTDAEIYKSIADNYAAGVETVDDAKALSDAVNEIDRLNRLLEAIGDYAHDHSTGPAVPDALWEVRRMAYEGETTDGVKTGAPDLLRKAMLLADSYAADALADAETGLKGGELRAASSRPALLEFLAKHLDGVPVSHPTQPEGGA